MAAVGMSVDEAFHVLGTGRFNIAVFLILCFNFMYVPMHIFGDLFNTRIPPHHCKDVPMDDDSTESDDGPHYAVPERSDIPDKYGYFYQDRTCYLNVLDSEEENETIKCKFGHWFDTSYTGETVVSEWDLVCENNSEVIFITIHGVSAVLGAVIFAPFSDKYGRKALLLMCWSQMSLMSLGMYFVGDMASYLVLRFLQRLYVEGAEQAIFILSCEMLPTNLRSNAVSCLFTFYGFGYLVLSLTAYVSTDWRHLQLAVAVGSFILLPINFILPESPYWLVFMGREKSAERFFREAAEKNKKKLPADFKLKREVVEDDGVNEEAESGNCTKRGQRLHPESSINISLNKMGENGHQDSMRRTEGHESRHTVHPHVGHFKELFEALKNKTLRKEAGIASFIWAVSAFLYYGITVSGFNPGDDAYLNFVLSGVAVVVSSSSTTFILQRFGRKKPITVFCFLCAIFMLLKTNIPYKIGVVKLSLLHKILKFLGKLTAAAIVSSTQLIVTELFPTTVRSTCVGLVAFFGLLGAAFGMYFSILERLSTKGSTIAAGLLTLLAGYLCRGLPDTSNRPLPGTIVDLMDSYVSVMEAIVSMMNKIPGGSDIPSPDSAKPKNHLKETDERRRTSRSASVVTFKSLKDTKRRFSLAAGNVFRKSGRRFSHKGSGLKFVKDERYPASKPEAPVNGQSETCTVDIVSNGQVNKGFDDDQVLTVTKF